MKVRKIVIIATIFLFSLSVPIAGAMTTKCSVNFCDDQIYSPLEDEPFFIIGMMDSHVEAGGFMIKIWWTSRNVLCKTKNSDWLLVGFEKLTIWPYKISYEFTGHIGLGSFDGFPFIICGIVKPI